MIGNKNPKQGWSARMKERQEKQKGNWVDRLKEKQKVLEASKIGEPKPETVAKIQTAFGIIGIIIFVIGVIGLILIRC